MRLEAVAAGLQPGGSESTHNHEPQLPQGQATALGMPSAKEALTPAASTVTRGDGASLFPGPRGRETKHPSRVFWAPPWASLPSRKASIFLGE